LLGRIRGWKARPTIAENVIFQILPGFAIDNTKLVASDLLLLFNAQKLLRDAEKEGG